MRLRTLLMTVFTAAVAAIGTAGTATAAPDAPPPSTSDTVAPMIVGGGNATQTYSFMVSLQSSTGSHICGGSLITARWVVTAAHCTSSSVRQVRIGSNNRTSGGQLIGVRRYVDHYSGDIALIELSSASTLGVVPVASSSGAIGTATRIIGWGQTCPSPGACGAPTYLQELNTSIVSDSLCSGIRAASEICTNNPNGNSGACYGDSGGPQIKSVSGRWQLIGATSRSGGGSVCATAPSIYVDVPYFRSWISSYVGPI